MKWITTLDPKTLLAKLIADNPDASPSEIQQGWVALVKKYKRLEDANLRETFNHLWSQSAQWTKCVSSATREALTPAPQFRHTIHPGGNIFVLKFPSA
jgi:hypothetical protein